MVAPTVLGRTRLSAHLVVAAVGPSACASGDRPPHAPYHKVVGQAVGLGVFLLGIEGVDGLSLDLLHHMRRDIVPTVGDGGPQVGYLQWCERHLALSDGYGDDPQRIPVVLESLVVERGIGNHSPLLARQVDAELVSESHTHHIVAPFVHGILQRAVFLLVGKHIVESPAEESVARRADGGNKVER